MFRPLSPLMLLLPLIGGCGGSEAAEDPAPRDPQVAQALADPLMTDPDLSSRNEGAAALTVEVDGSLPVLPPTPEAIAAARAEAVRIVGGEERMAKLPEPSGRARALSDDTFVAHLAALARGSGCASELKVSAIWAARMPAVLPIYPRGATLAAAGSEAARCKVRIVGYSTPVPVDDIVAFYWTRARAANLAPIYRMSAADQVLSGNGKNLAYDIRVHRSGAETIVRIATLQR